jgi:hypothetical protein
MQGYVYVIIFLNNALLHSQFIPVEFINSAFKVFIFIVLYLYFVRSQAVSCVRLFYLLTVTCTMYKAHNV